MKTILFALSFLFVLTGCGDGIPDVIDLHHPQDFDGKQMIAKDWMVKFCIDKPADNAKCLAVGKTMSMDATRGVMPKGY